MRSQDSVDLCLYLVPCCPSLILFFKITGEYAFVAIRTMETPMDTAWLPVLWPTRMAMPDGAALLLIQGVPEVLECVCAIRRGRWPRSRQLRHHGCQVRNFRLPELAQFSMNPTLESVRVSDSQEKYSTHGAAWVFLN